MVKDVENNIIHEETIESNSESVAVSSETGGLQGRENQILNNEEIKKIISESLYEFQDKFLKSFLTQKEQQEVKEEDPDAKWRKIKF